MFVWACIHEQVGGCTWMFVLADSTPGCIYMHDEQIEDGVTVCVLSGVAL